MFARDWQISQAACMCLCTCCAVGGNCYNFLSDTAAQVNAAGGDCLENNKITLGPDWASVNVLTMQVIQVPLT